MVGQEDGVFLSKSIKEAEQYVEKLFSEGKESASLCPYYNIKKEYRCFYLNGEVLLIYGKEKPYIIGKLLQGTLAAIYTYILINNIIFFNLDL